MSRLKERDDALENEIKNLKQDRRTKVHKEVDRDFGYKDMKTKCALGSTGVQDNKIRLRRTEKNGIHMKKDRNMKEHVEQDRKNYVHISCICVYVHIMQDRNQRYKVKSPLCVCF